MNKYKIALFSILFIITLIVVGAQTDVINLRDWVKVEIVSPLEETGAIPVAVQDQTTAVIDLFFVQLNGSITTLAENTTIDDRIINVTSVVDIDVGTYLGIVSGGLGRFYFGTVTAINGNIVTLDTPLDFNFSAGFPVVPVNREMNVDGSSTPSTFFVGTGGEGSNLTFDITRILIHFKTTDSVDLGEFGDLPSLTNGVVLRKANGATNNIFNVKNNGEISNLCFDYDPHEASNPAQGQNGANFRYTFAGQDKHGVAIRLEPGDQLQMIIQDDLTGLEEFRIIAEGHVVQN